MATEDNTISRAQSGDEEAFVNLMRAHYAFVYAVVIGIVDNPHDAEEIVQDTFFNAYRSLPDLEDTKKFKTWLAKIARNRALNWVRDQRFDTVSMNEVSEHALSSSDAPDQQLIHREQRELIRRAIETLSPNEREVARSYYLEGASYDELTSTHGLSYKAISVRLSRAKQKLAKRLGHLLTGVFVYPATTLKKIYSGGFTVMKIGTVPKITAGAVVIVVFAFIGTRQFMSSREDSSPSVEVVTSTESANSNTQRDSVHKGVVTAPSREDKPQISAEEMQQIEDFFAKLEGAEAQSGVDATQLATDGALDENADAGDATNSPATSEDTSQSAEDVMNAYLEAFRNFDVAAMRSFMTGAAKEGFESSLPAFRMMNGEFPEEVIEEVVNSGLPEEAIDGGLQMARGIMQTISKQMFSQAVIVSSESVGDEFHFRLRVPSPEISELLGMMGQDISEGQETIEVADRPLIPDLRHKMRIKDGTWQIYEY